MQVDLEKWLVEWVALKTEKRIRQEQWDTISDQLFDLSAQADRKVEAFRTRMQKELGIDPEVYWHLTVTEEPQEKQEA